jgi:hypothetical protein
MTTPTLGFEPDSSLEKHDVALIQLNDSIALFTQQRFLAALTLAGAAEEILGKLLVRKGELPAVKENTAAIERLRAATGLRIGGDASERELIDGWNQARNAAKHLVGAEDQPLKINLCDEAYWMIRRAIANAEKLGRPVAAAQDFENWVILNVNM